MKTKLEVDNKVLKITSNTVHETIQNMLRDRDCIKKVMVVTLGTDGVYRLNSSRMREEDRLAMCEIAKQKIINRMFRE